MSIDNIRSRIASIRSDITRLIDKRSRAATDRAAASQRANSARASASRASSASSATSYLRDVTRYEEEAARKDREYGDIERDVARKQSDLDSELKRLDNEERSLTQKREREEKDRERKQQDAARKREQEDRDRQRRHEQDERRRTDEQRRKDEESQRRSVEYEANIAGLTEQLESQVASHSELQERVARLSRLPEKIVVLFFASNPLDQNSLRLDEELRLIETKIRASAHRDSIELVSKWAVRPGDLLQALNQHSPHIIQFSGHGSKTEQIILQNDLGETQPMDKAALVQMMKVMAGNIKVAFFNNCFSAIQAESVVQYVDTAIGMNDSIGDDAAREFSAQFYSAIGFGKSVGAAFNQAKLALTLPGISEEDIPCLYVKNGVNADDLILVKPAL